jgi:hypothetical protein
VYSTVQEAYRTVEEAYLTVRLSRGLFFWRSHKFTLKRNDVTRCRRRT